MGNPTFTRAQLLTTEDLPTAQLEIKTQLSGTGIQGISSWLPGTAMQDTVQLLATFYVTMRQYIAQNALNACEPTASGSALDAISVSHFANYRFLGTQAVGIVTASLAPGSQAVSRNPGDVVLQFNSQFSFANINAFTLNGSSPSAVVTFQAVSPGSAFNVANNSSASPLVALPNVSFSNPAVGNTNSWLTIPGVDSQSDTSLHLLNQTKWSTLSVGAPAIDRYINQAVAVSSGVLSDVYVNGNNPNGPGTVGVYVATALLPATAAQLALYSGSIQSIDFNGPALVTVSAPPTVGLNGVAGNAYSGGNNNPIVVYYAPGTDTNLLLANLSAVLNTYIESTPTGGSNYGIAANIFPGIPAGAGIADIGYISSQLYQVPGVRTIAIQNQADFALATVSSVFKLVPPASVTLAQPLWPTTYLQLTQSVR